MSKTNTMKAEHYADIGQYLHDVREGHRVTIEQAAQMLHIHAKYLHKLEKGDLTDLPAKVYVRGYIKNYAEFLRLNPDEVLAGYEKLFDEDGQEFFVPENNLTQSMPSEGILWFCTAGLIAVGSYWYFAMHEQTATLTMSRELQLPSGPMPSDMPEEWKNCLSGDDATCFRTLEDKYALAVEAPMPEFMDVTAIRAAVPAPTPAATPAAPDEALQKAKYRHRHHKIAKPVEAPVPTENTVPDGTVDTDTLPKPDDNPAPDPSIAPETPNQAN